MTVQVSYPGVYIEEFSPGAPIAGVGTNTAAFIGPAPRGDINTPTKITSWDAFVATFGEQPIPGFYLWYAVRGFFENGGQVCYVVRASNGAYDSGVLEDQAGGTFARLRAHRIGAFAPPIQVTFSAASAVPAGSTLFQLSADYHVSGIQTLTLDDPAEAALIRPGDWLKLADPDARVQVTAVTGATVRVAAPLGAAPGSAGTLRLADALAGTRVFRIATAAPLAPSVLVPGTMLTVTQGDSDTQIVESVQVEQLPTTPNPTTTYRVTFRQGLAIPISMSTAATVEWNELDVQISQGGPALLLPNVSADPAHPRYLVKVINGAGTVLVSLEEPPPATRMPLNLPIGAVTLQGGESEDLTQIADSHFRAALDTLRNVDDVNLIAIPDSRTATTQQALIAHCEELADRFAVLDAEAGLAPFGAGTVEGIDTQRLALDSARGYAALYYPWLRVPPTRVGPPILVPPSGHVCGIIARSDSTRGVHKAPANEAVNGALAVERIVSDIDQGQLNLAGINVIRVFKGGRPTLFGARTTATDTNWMHVSTRRLFLFLEESIQEGIRWALFEPNGLPLWQKLKRTLTEFLTRVWRDGALFGSKPEEAFYVRIDEALNPFSEQALGRLTIEIGVRPVYPAEFIVVRIGIWPGGTAISEG